MSHPTILPPAPARGARGQVTAFVVIIVLALWLFAGLVIDGGLTLAAKRRAINEAEAAARAGAQAIAIGTFRTSGQVMLDPVGARVAARAYLAATGHPGTVHVTGRGTAVAERGVGQAQP